MLITEQQIYFNLKLPNRDDVLKFISAEAEKQNIVGDKNIIFQDLVNRENQYSTAFQEGIAIPHAKSSSVKEAKLFFVKMQDEVEWNSPDNFKVKVIFLILVPEEDAGTVHLQVLSSLAGKLMDEDFQKEVFEANDKSAILELLINTTE